MKILLESSRMYLREFTPDDAEQAYVLNSDPLVVQFTGDVPFADIEAARTFLQNYKDYQRNGMGRWVMIRKSDGTFLGWCGLKKHEDGMVDVGYRLHRKYWGMGYATEAAKVCLNHAFSTLHLSEVVAHATVSNGASLRVLEKIGMHFKKEVEEDSFPERVKIYTLSADQWRQHNQ